MSSIPAINNDLQDVSPASLTSADELHVADPRQDGQPRPNKYKYKEFESFSGERLLKSILRKVLPLALFETWQVLAAEHQADGNDAFLSIPKIAEARQRTERKIRLDLDELKARKLLSIRHEWKVFRQVDGSLKSRIVSVKDFERLYDLAHEYLLWTQEDRCIPPDREFVEAIREEEALVRKLRRFDNYRRILCNNQPGPAAQEKESHRWFTEYEEASYSLQEGEIQQVGTDVQEVADGTTEPIRKLYLKEYPQEELQKDSVERIVTSDNKDKQNGDSFDSALCSEERGGADYTKLTSSNEAATEMGTEEPHTLTKQANPTKLHPFASEKGRAAPIRQQADLDPRVRAFVELALTARQEGANPPIAKKKTKDATPNPLVERFVRKMSPILRDENLEGSVTRSLRAVERKGLSQMDILACLIMAYVVARDTKEVREQYRRLDGDLRMPLFCTMFERFANQRVQGGFDYDEDHLAQHIANDLDLWEFIETRRPEEMVLQAQVQELPTSTEMSTPTGTTMSQVRMEEPIEEIPQDAATRTDEPEPMLETDNPADGWSYQSADHFGMGLRDLLGQGMYQYYVLPTRCPGRYGFILKERSTNQIVHQFLTGEDLQLCRSQYRNQWSQRQ